MAKRKEQAEKISSAINQATAAQQNYKALRDKLDHQRLLMQAMWEVMKDKLKVTDDDMQKVMESLKNKNEAAAKKADNCPNCGRPLQENLSVCLYCGEEHGIHKLF